MKLNCDKELLMDIVNTVQKAISPKSVLPILECIKIDAHGNGNIKVTGYNTDICIEYNTQCDVTMGGEIALTSKMFGEIVRRLPDGQVNIIVNNENNVTKIKCGVSEFNIQGVDSRDYPNPPELEEQLRFKLPQTVLKNIIRRTIAFAAAAEGKRPILTGLLFEIRNNVLNVVASDGHRLALVKEELKENVENTKFVIPAINIRELAKLLKDDEDVEIIVSTRHVLFEFENFSFYTRIMDGEFLKYDAVMATTNSIITTVDRREITACLERAMLLINEDAVSSSSRKSPVRLNIEDGIIDIACITSRGQVNDCVNVKKEGGNLEIGFNCRFILDALAACDDDFVKMEFSTALGGCFVKPIDENQMYSFMILPVRLN